MSRYAQERLDEIARWRIYPGDVLKPKCEETGVVSTVVSTKVSTERPLSSRRRPYGVHAEMVAWLSGVWRKVE